MTLNATYKLSTTQQSGKQSLEVKLETKGIINGTEIKPTFTTWIEGNTEDKYKSLDAQTVYASAEGRYNIKMVRNSDFTSRTTVDYGEGEKTGRMYGYGFILQLYNEQVEYGLKGIELPKGEINFDIDMSIYKSNIQNTIDADIILWDYKINDWNTTGNLGRNMFFSNNKSINCFIYSVIGTRGSTINSVYNSGNILMQQDGNKIHVTVKDYDFDYIFPTSNYNAGTSILYSENIGCFSAGYFQIFIPDDEKLSNSSEQYYLNVGDNTSSFSAISKSGKRVEKQMLESDDLVGAVRYKTISAGTFDQYIYIHNQNLVNMSQPWGYDNAKEIKEKPFYIKSIFGIYTNNDEDDYIASLDRLIKFDADGIEPTTINNKYFILSDKLDSTGMDFNVWFVAKQDGTNWNSQEERNNAKITELLLYDSYEALKESGKICVGEYFESKTGKVPPPAGNNDYAIYAAVQLRKTAKIGNTYGVTQASKYWRTEFLRDGTINSEFTQFQGNGKTGKGYANYPTKYSKTGLNEPAFSAENRVYINREYDEQGNMGPSNYNGGYRYGQAILAIGGTQSVKISSIDENNKTKSNYNFDREEYKAKFKVEPKITVDNGTDIQNLSMKLEITLPKGLKYISNSIDEKYISTQEINENEDGTTTICLYLYGSLAQINSEKIMFEANIDQNSKNGEQYNVKAVISEIPDKVKDIDGNLVDTYKIGNSIITDRTNSTTIDITSLTTHLFFKETDTEIIEKNGNMHFKITYKNKTENVISEFAVLDVLPYNGDSRGTSFNGNYTVNKVIVTTQNDNDEDVENNNLKLYTANSNNSDNTIINYDIENDFSTSSIWNEISKTGNEYLVNQKNENDEVTAIGLAGEVAAKQKVIIDIYISTNNNESTDQYINSSMAQVSKTTAKMPSANVKVFVVNRAIKGTIWYDASRDSLMDTEEINIGEENLNYSFKTNLLSNIKIGLLVKDENDQFVQAKDIDGNNIEEISPNSDGTYSFDALPKGIYKVKITYPENYELVDKEKIANTTVTSKFNTPEEFVAYTDEITKLNTTALTEKTVQDHVNAGFTKTFVFEFTKVANENTNNKLGGVEFKLYKLVCEENDSSYHNEELINTENPGECWELVDEATSTIDLILNENAGKVTFTNLKSDTTYRLVETKTGLNRRLPLGQWTVKFEGEESPKIEAVGNPPAFIKGNDNSLKLPNMQFINIPTAGGIGIDKIIVLGILVSGIGIFIIKKSKNKK